MRNFWTEEMDKKKRLELKKLRKDATLTQKDLIAAVNQFLIEAREAQGLDENPDETEMAPSTISRYESGKMMIPLSTFELIKKVCLDLKN